ncbi:type II secretion system F family protein [Microlunatus sp. GCM10028923]|uniref:type II secretion system F family protein n=1 Tax=Microlunatus sp. GCM10028923 TaxID=3273400 RepID=UPI00361A8FD9
MNAVVAAAAGILVAAGLVAVVAGLQRTWTPPTRRRIGLGATWSRLTRRPPGRRGRQRDLVLVGSLLVGFVFALITGWLIAIPLGPVLAFGIPYLLLLPKAQDVIMLEALDRWVRSLASTLSTGKSITDSIRTSRRTAPPIIAESLQLLVNRLNNRWPTADALLRFADELDSADADSVIAAVILADRRGATGASVTLQALADSLQAQLKGRRLIETERAKPYIVVRQVTVITLVVLTLAFVFNGAFFEPYRTPLGQVLLAVLIMAYVGSLVLMRRKARHRAGDRILVGTPS